MPVTHVVLVTYGEPPGPAFVDQLTYSWRILLGLTRTIAPIPRPVIPFIALSRARSRWRMWTDEAYESPLEPITVTQAARLREALSAREASTDWRVTVAYEFRRPLVADVLGGIPADEPVVVVPMYAADSDFTHGLSRGVARELAHARPAAGAVRVAPALDAEVLGDAAAAHVRATVSRRDGWRGDDVALVLTAHGTLLQPARPIDTGLAATEALCQAIRTRLSDEFGLIVNGWLNHTRGGRWTEPPIDEALRKVAGAGFRRVVYFPYGFLADNAESQLEGRLALAAHPGLEAWHLPCLNDSALLIDTIAGHVCGHLATAGWHHAPRPLLASTFART